MAIAKVILNGDTLMDVTSNTVTSQNLLSGATAVKNDGTTITGEYSVRLQDRNVEITDQQQVIEATDEVCIINYTSSNYTYSVGTTSIGTKIYPILTNIQYKIIGTIQAVDTNEQVLEIYNIDNTFMWTSDNDIKNIFSSENTNYFYSFDIFNLSSGYVYFRARTKAAITCTLVFNLEITDALGFAGLSSVTIPGQPYYNIYETLALRSTVLQYSSQEVKDFCNSLTYIDINQFCGRTFQAYNIGSIVFSNVSLIRDGGFIGGKDTALGQWNGISSGFSFYFPALTSVASWTFCNQEYLTSIDMPILLSILSGTFYNCKNLKNVNFPQCETISSSAFWSCGSLLTVDFPNCTSIGAYAFHSCAKLSSVSFPKCVTLQDGAFQYCSSLTEVNFPSCNTIGYYAFSRCSNLTTAIFPNCTSIGVAAFNSCSKLVTISFPNCVNTSMSAFMGCSLLTEAIFSKCILISSATFYSCYSLTTALFASCTSIGPRAFYSCTNLSITSFPNCINVGSSAFYGCTSLQTISFPLCQNIEVTAFQGCSKLESFYLLGPSVVSIAATNIFNNTPMSNSAYLGYYGSIYVPSSLYNAYITATYWSLYSSRIVSV